MTEKQLMSEKNKRIKEINKIRLDLDVKIRIVKEINDEQVKRLFKREFKFAKRGVKE